MNWNEQNQQGTPVNPAYPPNGGLTPPDSLGRNPLQPMGGPNAAPMTPNMPPNMAPNMAPGMAPSQPYNTSPNALANPLTANVPPGGIMPNSTPNMAPMPGVAMNVAPNPNQAPQPGAEQYLRQEVYQSPDAVNPNGLPVSPYAQPPQAGVPAAPPGYTPVPNHQPMQQPILPNAAQSQDEATDNDVVWINRTKRVIAQTHGDPFRQVQLIQQLRVLYLKERFNRNVQAKDN